jgi:hypothetical protein
MQNIACPASVALAPIVLFVFNRPEQTRAMIKALSCNTLAARSELHIFSDGPRDAQDAAAVLEVRTICDNIEGFANVTVHKRPANIGLAHSVITGVTSLFESFDRVIVLEDDIVTSAHFLEYMNSALDHYADDSCAFSVTGYQFPKHSFKIPRNYAADTFPGYRASSWSWGTWKDRWGKVDWTMSYYDAFMSDDARKRAFAKGGADMITWLRQQKEGQMDSWAIRFNFAQYEHGMHCIYPVSSLVRNIGFDGSGAHGSSDHFRFAHNNLNQNWCPVRFAPAQFVDERLMARMRAVVKPPSRRGIRNLPYRIKRRVFTWLG